MRGAYSLQTDMTIPELVQVSCTICYNVFGCVLACMCPAVIEFVHSKMKLLLLILHSVM